VPTPDETGRCAFGNGPQLALVIGDSMAMSWLPGIQAALGDQWRIVGLTLESCPAADVPVDDTNGRYDDDCDTHHAWVLAQAAALDPQLVVLSSTEDTLGRLASNATGARAATEYQAALRRTITALKSGPRRGGTAGATDRDDLPGGPLPRVVTLAPPPKAGALTDCDTAGGAPADCMRPISNQWVALASAERAVAGATGTAYVDTRLWFCDSAGFCPSFIGSKAVRWDTEHLTDVYARFLAGPLRQALIGDQRQRQ
jgi:hypothetical protein